MNRKLRREMARKGGAPALGPLLDEGMRHHQAGRLAEAEALYRRVLAADPAHADALHMMGLLALQAGRAEEAVRLIAPVARRFPNTPELQSNLGNALRALGRLEEADASYRRALALRPDFVEALNNRATVLDALGRADEAEPLLGEALRLRPDYVEAWNNLGGVRRSQGRLADAAASYRKALALRPAYPQAHGNLGQALFAMGEADACVVHFDAALRLRPQPALEVMRAVALPAIYDSAEDLRRRRAHWVAEVERLESSLPAASLAAENLGTPSFFLAYQGEDDRPLVERLARLYLRLGPGLAWEAPHCARPEPLDGRRIRVGVVSRYLRRHTIGKLYRGLLRGLDRERFETVLFHFGRVDEEAAAIAGEADRAVPLAGPVRAMAERVAAERLDVLFYPDIGMEPTTYFLAFARLAPLQCVSWGHPVTTGIPNVDLFISSDLVEPEGAEAHYRERLARLPVLPTCYQPPPFDLPGDRAGFGFAEGERVYACPQSLFKMHPDFDAVLAELLRRDPRGRLVLIEGSYAAWTERLRARLARGMPDVCDRVTVLGRLGEDRFLRLLATADVLLDPLHFGSGNTAFEAFAVGTPLVTLPGAYMRGRVTLGCYRQMGLDDCVARDPAEYVEKALRLASDAAWRQQVAGDIRARRHRLYDDATAVREVERVFAASLSAAASGR